MEAPTSLAPWKIMHITQDHTSDVAILSRLLQPGAGTLSASVARAFLALSFPPADQMRMRELSAKAQDGTLTGTEQNEINNYERVGHILSVLKSKARRSLQTRVKANGKARNN
jgi:hypothetical protein